MSDRREPSSRRRGGPLPPVGARTPGLDDLADDDDAPPSDSRRDEWGDDEWYEPNYLVRRALVVAAVIAVLALGAFAVAQLIGDDDEGSRAGGASGEWNRVVVLTTDEIRVVDPNNGDVEETFESTDDLLDAQSVVSGDVLVTMTDAGRITMTDLGDGTTKRARAGVDETLRLAPENPRIAIAGSDSGGDIVLADTSTLETITVGTVADLDEPLIFPLDVRVNPGGTHVAMSDARSFQSVVVDVEAESAVLLAGQVLAIGDDSVVTAQRAGDDTELEFYDLAGERLGSVDVPTPSASMLTRSGTMLLVDAVGTIRSAAPTGDVEEIGVLAPATTEPSTTDVAPTFDVTGGRATAGGTRLLVTTSTQVHVLRDDGTQLAVADGQIAGSQVDNMRCVVIGSSRSTGSKILVDTDDGSTLVQIPSGVVGSSSVDGCTVALIGNGQPQLVVDGELRDVDASSIVDVAPDGSAYVVLDGRDTELVSVGDDSAVELAEEPSVIRFAQR